MQNQFKIERFSSQKKKLKEKKNRVRVRKMNLLDVALRKIESVHIGGKPKVVINIKLALFLILT